MSLRGRTLIVNQLLFSKGAGPLPGARRCVPTAQLRRASSGQSGSSRGRPTSSSAPSQPAHTPASPVAGTKKKIRVPGDAGSDPELMLTEAAWAPNAPAALAAQRPAGTGYGFVAMLRSAWEARAWGQVAGLLRSLAARISLRPHVHVPQSGPTSGELAAKLRTLAGALHEARDGSPVPNESKHLAELMEALYWAKKGGEGVYEPGVSMEGVLDPPAEAAALLKALDPATASSVVELVQPELMRSDLFDQVRFTHMRKEYVKGVELIAGSMQMYSFIRELSKTYFPTNYACSVPPTGWPWGCGRLESQLGFMDEVTKGELQHIAEVHMMRWQLDQMADYGEYSRAADLPCDPRPAPKDPRLALVIPFVASETERVLANLKHYNLYPPCQGGVKANDAGGKDGQPGGSSRATDQGVSGDWPHRHRADLVLYFAGDAASLPAPFSKPQEWSRFLEGIPGLACFGHVRVLLGNLTAAEQFHPGRGHVENTGQVNLLFRVLGMNGAHGTSYDYVLLMESDVLPIRAGWLGRVYQETLAPAGAGGVWMKGVMQNPPWTKVGAISEHHYHMNMNSILRIGDPCFVRLLRRVEAEFPKTRWPFDAAVHLFMRARQNYRFMQRFASRFVYGDFLINWLLNDPIPVEQLRRDYPFAVLVHGKNVEF
eukprot:jgi/Mesvir1/11827/Mv00179-RA.1